MDAATTTTRRHVTGLIVACAFVAVAFAAYHFYLRELMIHRGLTLGAVRPGVKVYRIVPLYLYWRPRLKTGVLIATAVLAGFVWWLRRSLRPSGANKRAGSAVVASLMAWHVAIAVSVALIDGGPGKLWEPFHVHRRSDYIGAVEWIDRPQTFLQDYPQLMPDLPLHCRTHPPGGPLLLWMIAHSFGPGPFAASMATILLSSLATPAVYLLARDVLDEAPARLAAGIFLLAPNVVAYSATCLDAVFMVPLVWTMCFLWIGRRQRPMLFGMAAGITGSLAALMTFSASVVELWAVVALVLTAFCDPTRLRNTLVALAAAAVSSVLFYAVLNAWSGYDPLAVLRQAFEGQHEITNGRGHSTLRQSVHFAVTNFVAFAFCSGLPIVLLWLRQSVREIPLATSSSARWLLLSFLVTLVGIDVAPLYTLETERIWIFLVGFMAIGAAAHLNRTACRLDASPLVTAALLLQAGQTVLMEVLFEWVW
ncbi:MAG TPA: glycosyltransferase family 39 protein [Pirellulales bacterium]|nr:glycosyltransferase family 39 protein [Pirellulales bacterium]